MRKHYYWIYHIPKFKIINYTWNLAETQKWYLDNTSLYDINDIEIVEEHHCSLETIKNRKIEVIKWFKYKTTKKWINRAPRYKVVEAFRNLR